MAKWQEPYIMIERRPLGLAVLSFMGRLCESENLGYTIYGSSIFFEELRFSLISPNSFPTKARYYSGRKGSSTSKIKFTK